MYVGTVGLIKLRNFIIIILSDLFYRDSYTVFVPVLVPVLESVRFFYLWIVYYLKNVRWDNHWDKRTGPSVF